MKTINDLVKEYQEKRWAHGFGFAPGSPILNSDYVSGLDDFNFKSKLFFAIRIAFILPPNKNPVTHCESSLVAA